jgi:hypothetical protein
MSDERYLFTVRQRFGETPVVDSFYRVRIPSGLTGEQAKTMIALKEDYLKEERSEDVNALNGMQLRLRFNQDMFQKVCMVSVNGEIDAEALDIIVAMKHKEGTLAKFLKDASL